MTPQDALEAIVAERCRHPGGVQAPGGSPASEREARLVRASLASQYAGRLADMALHGGRFNECDLWAALGAVCMAALERL